MNRSFLISCLTGLTLGILAYVSIRNAKADCPLPYVSMEIEKIEIKAVQTDIQVSEWPTNAELDADIVSFYSMPEPIDFCFEAE